MWSNGFTGHGRDTIVRLDCVLLFDSQKWEIKADVDTILWRNDILRWIELCCFSTFFFYSALLIPKDAHGLSACVCISPFSWPERNKNATLMDQYEHYAVDVFCLCVCYRFRNRRRMEREAVMFQDMLYLLNCAHLMHGDIAISIRSSSPCVHGPRTMAGNNCEACDHNAKPGGINDNGNGDNNIRIQQ